MGTGASSALGPPRPPPHGRRYIVGFGSTEAVAACASGRPPLWDQRARRHMGEGASSALGPLRLTPHGLGGILIFWDHRGPRRMGAGASSALGPPRPPPHGRRYLFGFGPPRPLPHVCRGLLRFESSKAPYARARGPPRLWDHRGSRHMD